MPSRDEDRHPFRAVVQFRNHKLIATSFQTGDGRGCPAKIHNHAAVSSGFPACPAERVQRNGRAWRPGTNAQRARSLECCIQVAAGIKASQLAIEAHALPIATSLGIGESFVVIVSEQIASLLALWVECQRLVGGNNDFETEGLSALYA